MPLLFEIPFLWIVFYHLVPLTPFVTRLLLCSGYSSLMRIKLTTEEKDREANRTIILGLVGVSFTGLLALTIVDAKIDLKTFYPVFYMLISFLCFITALNLQAYKRFRWHNIFGAALIEAAILSILLAITAIIWSSNQSGFYKILFSVLAFSTWSADHYIHLRLLRKYLKFLSDKQKGKVH